MYVLIWRYRVHPGQEGAFREHYTPAGSWARLFENAPGYLGTELLECTDGGDFVTIDRWVSEAAHRGFLDAYGEAYRALDEECEALTESETFLGAFREAANRE